MEDMLIWVDAQDHEIGAGPKLATHEKAQLHRAFSLFLYDPQAHAILLQRRARSKYHSGGLWSNTCCSHPRVGERTEDAVRTRLRFELGLSEDADKAPLTHCGSFIYRADFPTGLSEHELDHVYVLAVDKARVPLDRFNREEIEALRWVTLDELEAWMDARPEEFSAWFGPAYRMAKQLIEPQSP